MLAKGGDGASRVAAPLTAGEMTGNLLLGCLGEQVLDALAPHLERLPFAVDDQLARAGERIDWVWFPEGALAGILDPTDGERPLALGLVGREGMIGWPLLLGETHWPHDVAMRAAPGTVLRCDAGVLRALCAGDATLRDRLLRFVHVFMMQVNATAVSAMLHPVERRMARWILLYQDRLGSDEIMLTHEEFRLMLGVRRSSVTDALHRLEAEHAVRALRGRVIVRDRQKLIALAGPTYGRAERDYGRLLLGQEAQSV